MADRFYGIDREGAKEPRVTIDTSTTSDVIELRVRTGVNITAKDVARAMVRLLRAVQEDTGRDEV